MDGVIDRYVDGLAAALPGPRSMRDDMVAEARHSLLDAAEVFEGLGLEPVEAERRAVREFGHHHEVVPGYRAELAAAQGRRTALWIAVVLPVITLLEPLMWWRTPWSQGAVDPGYWVLTGHYEGAALAGSVVAVLLLIGFGWGSRYVRDGLRYVRWIGIGVLGFLVGHGATGAAVIWLSLRQWPEATTWPPVIVGLLANTLAFSYTMALAWRCVRVSRPSRAELELRRSPAA